MKPTLLVMAAGMGSRYGGVKQIDAVGMHGECLLDYGVYDARRYGYGRVVFIIRRDIEKDFRERLFDRVARNMDAEYVFQDKTGLLTPEEIELSKERKKPWGTIHAVLSAEKAVKTPFTVVNADDYYGASAYETLGKYLSTLGNDSTAHAMVGFQLDKTMSLNGSVSRGVCKVDSNGMLLSMVENTKIEFTDGGRKIVSHMEYGDDYLTGLEPVSMNFFGFTPKAFEYFNEYWDDFKRNNLTEQKKESLLPNAAGDMVKQNRGTIRVFTTKEQWFGMTYPEDKAAVMGALKEKIASGYYPEKLWEK